MAVEAVDLLRVLGHSLMSAVVDRYESSLAALVAALAELTAGEIPSRADLEWLVLHRFGPTDPLTVAVRYRLFSTAPFDVGPEEPPAMSGADVYRAPPGLQLLMDVPDCDAATAGVASSRCFSYVRWPTHPAPVRIDPPVAHLIGCFEAGCSLADVLDELGVESDRSPSWLTQLVEIGLLVPVH